MTIPSPEYEWIETVDTAFIVPDPAAGALSVGTTRDTQIRRFHLMWEHASQSDKDDIWDEYAATLGEAGTTSYTPSPRGEVTAVTVRFVGTPEASWSGGNRYAMTCVLEEVNTPY